MPGEPLEQHRVSEIGYHDLEGRPAFEIEPHVVGDRWYLYLTHPWHSGWSILDVTDPEEPEFVRFIEGPDNTFTYNLQPADDLLITSLQQPRAVGRVDGYEFDPDAPYAEGAYIFDIGSDPENPERIGHYETGGTGTHRNFYDGGDYAYMAANVEGFTDRIMTVVDVSEPSEPEEVGRWWWPGQSPDDDVELEYDKFFHGPPYVKDDRAYLSYGHVGVPILDVSDVTNPEMIARIDVGDLGGWMGTHSAIPIPDTDVIAVNSEPIREVSPFDDGGEPLWYVFLADVSDEREAGWEGSTQVGPRIVSSFPQPTPEEHLPYDNYYEKPGRYGPHNQHHYREGRPRAKLTDHVVMTFFNAGLRIYDISDPLVPKETGYYVGADPESRVGTSRPSTGLVSQFEDVVVDTRGVIYVSDIQQGLFILESPDIE